LPASDVGADIGAALEIARAELADALALREGATYSTEFDEARMATALPPLADLTGTAAAVAILAAIALANALVPTSFLAFAAAFSSALPFPTFLGACR
jgi:hypothetical protein